MIITTSPVNVRAILVFPASQEIAATRLDLNALDVQSFATDPFPTRETDTVIEGPDEPVVVTDPLPIDPETRFHPCTRQLTCVGCA